MPSPEIIERALQAIKRPADYDYFFGRLTSPDWISPLRLKGFFRSPPAIEREGNIVRIPFWPESQYLARMAGQAPELVMDVILGMPETENTRVHEDIVDAALGMPAEVSQEIVPKVGGWLETRSQILLPRKLRMLCEHLARNSEIGSALDLCSELLAISVDDTEQPSEKDESGSWSAEPQARIEIWEYEEILGSTVPILLEVQGSETTNLLLRVLERAVEIKSSEASKPEDYSYIWRPSIESDGQDDIENLLVSAVRDAVVRIVEDGELLTVMASRLGQMPWRVFHRLGHYLLSRSTGLPGILAEEITNRDHFDEFRHEYRKLLELKFGELKFEDQDLVLGWIKDGLDLAETQRAWRQWDENVTDVDAARYVKAWRLERLEALKSYLSSELESVYADLVNELGEIKKPDEQAVWVGHETPKTAEEIQRMSVHDVVDYLQTWQPPAERWRTPSPEGLGRALHAAVAAKPQRFAEEAMSFVGCDRTYLRHFIDGLQQAVGQNEQFAWESPLALCRWVVSQSTNEQRDPDKPSHFGDFDPDWKWTRASIVDLLESGLKSGEGNRAPIAQRDAIWRVLSELTDDPDPDPLDDSSGDGDPLTTSLNRVRGKAMHTVVQYGLWVRRHLEESGEGNRIETGFNEMPEMRNVLERHLSYDVDRSLAIRAVYGQWYPWLHLLDPSWAQIHLAEIFPISDEQNSFWQAAWHTYLNRNQPYDNVFDVLRPVYELAVDRIGLSSQRVATLLADPDHRLVEHLMILYWRGKIQLIESNGILQKFYEKPGVSDELRGHALDFLGRSLHEADESIGTEVLTRLKDIWITRVGAADQSGLSSEEFTGFGWWFASGVFEDDWAIEQLSQALRLSQKVEPGHLVVERLVDVFDTNPLGVVRCLDIMIRGDADEWGIYSWRDGAHNILSAAIRGEHQDVRNVAVDLIHWLGARGHSEFRELIRSDV